MKKKMDEKPAVRPVLQNTDQVNKTTNAFRVKGSL